MHKEGGNHAKSRKETVKNFVTFFDPVRLTNETDRKAGDGVRKRRSGQEISQEVLCGEYEAVYRYALTLCQNRTGAQDLTQETFLKAMKSSERFTGDSSLYTWLCAIAKNTWVDWCRKQKREVPGDEQEKLEPGQSVEETVEKRDEAMRLHQLIHQLKEPSCAEPQ